MDTDRVYFKTPYSFPPREQDNDGMDQHNVVTTTRDVGIRSKDVSYDRLVERAQQAEDQRRVSSDLLISFITQDKGPLLHLEAIIAGKVSSTWASSKGRVDIFFEEDEQLDRVMGFLTSLVEAQTTRCHNQVAFMMDVLLPEATIHALSAVHEC
ncbi:PWWP domain-containing DNA repair factor 3A-like isoform X2 [Nothobranchius furzeri]|uniref:PWWP domain-containing DNA repair factor 3A-like n=1 Tax=Nothobranchius furzeri TaxID=105023 RepID=UPI003904CE24